MGTRRLIAIVLTVVALSMTAAACGSDDDGANGDTSTTEPIGGDNQGSLGPPTILTLAYSDGEGDRQGARLTCADDTAEGGGYLAKDAEQACKALASGPVEQLVSKPPAADRVCTQIYGGPQTLKVDGRLDYDTVERSFKRTNGCEISDWNKLAPILPPS